MRKHFLTLLLAFFTSVFLLSMVSGQTLLWEHTWGGADDDANAVAVRGDYVYMAGSYLNPSGDPDAFVAKFDKAGNLIWDRLLDIEEDGADDVAVDSQGNVYLVGSVTNSLGEEHGFIAKFNSGGVL